ncbi:MAG: ribosome recycling factor family protein [Colwellia sp.]|nr:ribosome recycling factor family protein [Colwellia sp.]
MEKINTVTLPSFLRRTMKAYVLKGHIRQQGCELHRIGRSRNWQLKANFEQLQTIIAFVDLSNEPSWLWLAKLLRNEYKHLTHDELLRIASTLEELTISALIARSDCTIAQARTIIDELEGLD